MVSVVTPTASLAALLVGAMRSDGREHPDEHEVVSRHIAANGGGGALRALALVEEVARSEARLGRCAVAASAAAALPREMHDRALSAMIEVIVADRRVSREEREYFLLVSHLLERRPRARRSASTLRARSPGGRRVRRPSHPRARRGCGGI